MAAPNLRAPGNLKESSYIPIPRESYSENETAATHVNSLPPTGEDRNRPRWKPFTLKTPFLLFLFLITVSLIIIVEFLNQKSQKDKALIFTGALSDLTTFEQFNYKYLLTIISVLYGMVWASVDLDIKRLEPFFQLSNVKGVSAASSILLHYPFDFLATVPITALSRKHYSVFSSGFALILIFGVITPMHAGLLAISPIKRDILTQFVPAMEFLPFDLQSPELNAQYFYTAFGIIFLGEKMQPWTNWTFIAMPFEPLDTSRVKAKGMKEFWTATTRTYTTDFNCTSGTVINSTIGESYNITRNSGRCGISNHSPILFSWPTRAIQYIGAGNHGGNADYYLYCDDPHTFLIIWAQTTEYGAGPGHERNRTIDIVPIFCKSSYSYTDTNITVDPETFLVTSKSPGTPVPFTQDDKIIDLDRFEEDMSTGASVAGSRFIAVNAPTKPGILGLGDQTRQVSFSLGLSPDKGFEDLKDPKTLAKTFTKGQKFLFSTFAHSLLRNITENNTDKTASQKTGHRTVLSLGVVVIKLFAHLLEGFLAVVAICFAFLGIVTYRRHTNLFGDPDSLAAKMALVADSKLLLQDFDGLDESPKLKKCFPGRTYRLGEYIWDSNGYYRIDLEEKIESSGSSSPGPARNTVVVGNPNAATRPLVLRTGIGIFLVLFLLLVLSFLIFLWNYASKNNGLPILSKNQIVVQTIFSVIPAVLATGLEPLWVLITRYFCVYQPYTELFKGNAPFSTSLSTKYTSVPPALILFRAFRAGHFILFSLSATSLLCNLLAVSLGGLFSNEPRLFDLPKNLTQVLSPQINALTHWDSFNTMLKSFAEDDSTYLTAAWSNITQGTDLPAWVTKDYYFLPFEWDSSVNISDSHKATTRGFGVSLDCVPLEGPALNATVSDYLNVTITLPVDDGRTVLCAKTGYSTLSQALGNPGEQLAGEYFLSMQPVSPGGLDDQALRETCYNALVRGWARLVKSENDSEPKSFKNITTVCHQTVKTAMFEVEVNGQHKVLDYKMVGSHDDPNQFFTGLTTARNFTSQIADVIKGVGFYSSVSFHNSTTFSESWTSYLMEKSLLTGNISDPFTPLPDFNSLSKALGDIWSLEAALILGTNSDHVFQKLPTPKIITGVTTTLVQRAIMRKTMFYITVIILVFNTTVAVIAYLHRPKNFLPRFPDTLASEIAYFYSSQVLRDVSGTAAMTTAARDRHLSRLGHRYGFGYYKGEDWKYHRGVERSSLLEARTE